MSTPATGVYAGVPAAQRHAERRARLMAAALELLGTVGWSGTTVRAVCAEAKLTPRFFYQSFPDLDALVVAVFDEVSATTTARVLAAVRTAVAEDPADRLAHARAAIGTLVVDLTDDPRRARVVFVEALGHEALARRRLASMRTLAGLIAHQGRASFGTTARDEGLVAVTSSLLAGGIAELLIAWLDGEVEVTRDELVEDCAELLVAVGEGAARIARRRAQVPGTDIEPPNSAR
ncbi:TetR/AcrR family transcriptional regulator [Conexibacter sp. W3-3-2]|uniref:TetR/AcrR family transcriptional regulator n=1 Tax=Conexibacter sp. W3-3-2 TaxID=2675227 RepID=UPI002814A44C|nr:TetR/AcrR family transcriptional regulator [Conexibacter sp. W3-3-2]